MYSIHISKVWCSSFYGRRGSCALISSMVSILPPSSVKGMTKLDRNSFKTTISVPAIIVEPQHVNHILKALKRHLINVRAVKPVIARDDGRRILLLDPVQYDSVSQAEQLLGAFPPISALGPIKFDSMDVSLGYENWSAEEILRSVLPDDIPNVSGFSVIGHIAHLNLRDSHAPYKCLIAQVLLDKHKNLATVVNKTTNINNTYRNFSMEILAGKAETNVTVKENGCTYCFDFAQVYWNPRLGTEHERLVKELAPHAVVYDIFAGIGPFSVPAAKKGCTVYANDLNPESYKALSSNLTKNKVKGTFKTFNVDGRVFIKDILQQGLEDYLKAKLPVAIIMNLPAMAIEFLPEFTGLTVDAGAMPDSCPGPTVYCYCFSTDQQDCIGDIVNRINTAMSLDLLTKDNVHVVRNVAPGKEMLCAKFELPVKIFHSYSEPPSNKMRRIL